MICITEAETEQQIADLKDVVAKMKTGTLVARVKQYIARPDGGFNEMVVKENAFDGNFNISINDTDIGYFYLDVVCPKKSDMKAVYNLWNVVLTRTTQNYVQQKANDYALVIDVTKGELEHNKIYVLSGFQPVWISEEGSSLTKENSFRIAFPLSKIFYEVAEVTPAEQEYYEMENQGYDNGYEDDYDEYEEAPSDENDNNGLGSDISDEIMSEDSYI